MSKIVPQSDSYAKLQVSTINHKYPNPNMLFKILKDLQKYYFNEVGKSLKWEHALIQHNLEPVRPPTRTCYKLTNLDLRVVHLEKHKKALFKW